MYVTRLLSYLPTMGQSAWDLPGISRTKHSAPHEILIKLRSTSPELLYQKLCSVELSCHRCKCTDMHRLLNCGFIFENMANVSILKGKHFLQTPKTVNVSILGNGSKVKIGAFAIFSNKIPHSSLYLYPQQITFSSTLFPIE